MGCRSVNCNWKHTNKNKRTTRIPLLARNGSSHALGPERASSPHDVHAHARSSVKDHHLLIGNPGGPTDVAPNQKRKMDLCSRLLVKFLIIPAAKSRFSKSPSYPPKKEICTVHLVIGRMHIRITCARGGTPLLSLRHGELPVMPSHSVQLESEEP